MLYYAVVTDEEQDRGNCLQTSPGNLLTVLRRRNLM